MGTRKTLFGGELIIVLFMILNTVRSESNVAVYKVTAQKSNYQEYIASKAVDNCTNTNFGSKCCAHTAVADRTVWWRVDLGELMTIIRIQIYYRQDYQHRMAGYQLYVSNTTSSPTDGVLCYEDTSSNRSDVQLVVTHQCSYVGRYVTVYNYRNNPKRYSWYSDNAILELCEVQVFGCQVGRYGDGHCNNQCPGACYGGNCNSTTGACFYCVPQKYGIRCEQDCSTNCLDRLCDNVNGYCYDCVSQKYGVTCDQDCSTNCLGRLCEKNNGDCYECIPGKFGNTCDQNCSSNCKDRLCVKDTGHCLVCIPGKYGDTCDQDCPRNCKDRLCGKSTGNCIECVTGKYTNTCDQDCPSNCNQTCGMDSGYCRGCIAGSYGVTCSLTCPVTCKDFVCNQQTGQCIDCYPGKYGVVCGADCPDTCTDNICRKDDGQCLTTDSPNTEQSSADSYLVIIAVLAVICGLLIAALIASVIAIFLLRRTKSRMNPTDKSTERSEPDTGYTSISREHEETPHVYEMMVT